MTDTTPPAARHVEEPAILYSMRKNLDGWDNRVVCGYIDALLAANRDLTQANLALNRQLVMVRAIKDDLSDKRQAAETRALAAQNDAERYRGLRSVKYRMYAADARSLGPQMKWEGEETFNATYDRRADEAIDAAAK